MQVATIAPTAYLGRFDTGSRYHMALAHLVLADETYANYFCSLSRQGHHVMLDNSAHEFGHGFDPARLQAAIDRIEPTEIFLPDRLFFGEDTVELSREAFEILAIANEMSFIGVPQGRTLEEWMYCAFKLLKFTGTLGLSKDYEVWRGGIPSLVEKAVQLGAKTIHLLGLPRSPKQVSTLIDHPRVRGIDTSKMVTMGILNQAVPAGQALLDLDRLDYAGRVRDFFSTTNLTLTQEKLCLYNTVALRDAVGDRSVIGIPADVFLGAL